MNARRNTAIVAMMALISLVITVPAAGQITIEPGSDFFRTAGPPTGESPTYELFDTPIPPGVFGEVMGQASAAFYGRIDFKSHPFQVNEVGGGTFEVDTIVDRLQTTGALNIGESATVNTRMIALSLKSTGNITIDFGPSGTAEYSVRAGLTATQNDGSMTIYYDDIEGGRFSSTTSVKAKLVFTLEAGVAGLPVVVFEPDEEYLLVADGCWSVDGHADFQVASAVAGSLDICVGGNYDGFVCDGSGDCVAGGGTCTGSVSFLGDAAANAAFNIGICYSGKSPLGWIIKMIREYLLYLEHYVQKAWKDTCGDDPDLDGIPECRDNCPDDYNPDQLDGDNDGLGYVCDPCCHPAISEWGVVIMALLALAVGTIVFTRRRKMAA